MLIIIILSIIIVLLSIATIILLIKRRNPVYRIDIDTTQESILINKNNKTFYSKKTNQWQSIKSRKHLRFLKKNFHVATIKTIGRR